jgi:hypothetical protein
VVFPWLWLSYGAGWCGRGNSTPRICMNRTRIVERAEFFNDATIALFLFHHHLHFMAALNWIALLLTHPLEFKTLLQFWLYHESKRDIAALKEHPTSGWDRQTMQRCWHFLDMTSRSFSAVIKELDGELARTVNWPNSVCASRACARLSHHFLPFLFLLMDR